MARGINKVILVGNLGNEPDIKYTQSGMTITSISLATSSGRKDREGNTQERTEWHRVKFFGKLGEIAAEYLHKGSQCYIEGTIRYDKFTGQDGQERYVTEIIADQMHMLGGRGEGSSGITPQRRPAKVRNNDKAYAYAGDGFHDDAPPF
ncbi:single-stranded DNA-binding protein [Xylella fastidiosa subsp. multiplex]|uniref:Single-stranded DNA-binding protein n=2 Tax=Xylella fastidiosa TaxID=2371 RepID=A0A9Q4MKQ5_XYLFS|nr:single-stranded DNA-binding protein [Xylella fastidiosa]MBE0267822.1 single-stranded DNA-binding protein [Xylella fastidiosa subsp. multiplex]MBE0274405.1 single-stranded DNA-binding protein [Xylella fastidiosa subsp. multiplex]MBE0276792.1 single-stranded DNA-binding protein [Xylella fastidiosa subsp. multiplex]MBE0281200.1 single-stranded DNA-binding protein [Xylella fastidiosa subsp. multiplex]MRT54315.1 single-stranded DNA-binding protein [Xylella fastidiosa subsp. multiplex]